MPLFQVAILETGKKKKDLERLVVKPKWVIAKDAAKAGMKTAMEYKDDDLDLDRMQVIVVPFG
jgi:hypothetical protein